MNEKVAVVTGAGTGIGRACAIALAQAGYRVALAGRKADALQATITQAQQAGMEAAQFLACPTDVTQEPQVRELFAATVKAFGRVDVLFNNAGMGARPVPMEDLTAEEWQAVVGVNLNGMFYCAQAAIRCFKAQTPQGGRIINNGSISATAPRPFSAPYTATKHAVSGLTKSISLDGRPFNIACGQIDIGNAATDMTTKMAAGVLQADGSTRVEPRMDVAHVASAVVYMASLPLDANVQTMTIMATNMPLVGRG